MTLKINLAVILLIGTTNTDSIMTRFPIVIIRLILCRLWLIFDNHTSSVFNRRNMQT